jgi:hypothetical protein
MPARERNFIIDKGSDFQRTLYLAPGPDADIRNFTARMQIRASVASEPFLLELTTANGRITCDYGVITLNLPNAITETVDTSTLTTKGKILEPANAGEKPYEGEGKLAVYDLELVSPAGIVSKYLYGKVVFVDNVTR